MNRKILLTVLAFALLMLLAAFTPVFAGPPTKGTYTQVVVDHTIEDGEEKLTGEVLHIRGASSESYMYGGPPVLGDPLSSFSTAKGELNIVTLTGTWIGHTVDTYTAGTVEGLINVKFPGAGPYVYTGPTFTFTLGGVTATLTTGDVFAGLLYEILVVKHGTGDLAGFTLEGQATGLSISAVIVGDPNMVGFGLGVETGRYSWVG